jgi:peptide/nickel transport system substrate-binding protein
MRQIVRTSRAVFLVLAALLVCTACGSGPARPAPETSPATDDQQTLIIAIRVEPNALTTKVLQSAGNLTLDATRGLFNANLVATDGGGAPLPHLAEELPTLHTDSWRVVADGRMETTYRLKPGLTWHDGTPLSARDFAFAWRVYATPELGVAAAPPESMIEAIDTPDDRTVAIQWRQPFPDAGLLDRSFPPLPRHLLEEAYETRSPSGESFVSQPFWSSGYVGLGPYRVRDWEPGTAIDADAFPGYVLGRPRIERIRLVFINDPNTVVANLLSGAAQLTFDDAIRFEQGAVLRREWADGVRGAVFWYPQQVRYTEVQLKPDLVQPVALTDLRVRRALAHAVDKQSLVDGLLDGVGTPADTIVSPRVDYFDALNRAISTYPYDVRETERLMGEAGLAKKGDGFYADAAGERLAPEIRVRASAHNQAEMAIMADGWSRAGIAASSYVIPAAQSLDSRVLATFPGLSTTSRPAEEAQLVNLTTSQIPSAENRWSGSNRGGWSNPEYDRLAEAFATTLDRAERNQQVIQMMRIFNDDVPGIYLYYNEQVVAMLTPLRGPAPIATSSVLTWNVHLWELR